MENKLEILKSEKAITLVSLIITIIVLLIIATVSISSGTASLDNTRIQGFYTQLEIIQKRVDDIAATNESYIDTQGNIIYLKEQGVSYDNLSNEQKTNLTNILSIESIEIEPTNFRYFTTEDLNNVLDLLEMDYNVFIDFENRIVISEEGIEIEGKHYYVLRNSIYFVEHNANKNEGTIENLDYHISKYTENTYKVNITLINTIGDLPKKGYVEYKKSINKYWITSTNTEIIIELFVEYNIKYIDSNNNTLEKNIILELDKDNNPIIKEI